MSEAGGPLSVTIAAVPGQVRVARVFVAQVLGESQPDAGVAVLLASELAANSVLHSGSAVSGGVVTVTVAVGERGVRVEVTDRSGAGVPVLAPAAYADGEAEGSRGNATRGRARRTMGLLPRRQVRDDVVRAM
jgi:anti-sigma regulatory factor (Ser/Thr protein kinase)